MTAQASIEDRLATMRPLLEIAASERQDGQNNLWDDMVQEGLIAAWQAMERHPGKEDVYYRAAGKNGVRNLVRGRSHFGSPSRQGRRDAMTAAVPLVHTRDDGSEYLVAEPVEPCIEDMLMVYLERAA